MVGEILSYVEPIKYYKCSLVCKLWNTVINSKLTTINNVTDFRKVVENQDILSLIKFGYEQKLDLNPGTMCKTRCF
jgi:hypothetical protein